MVVYLPNAVAVSLLLLVLKEGECILLHQWSVTECFKAVKGPTLWKKKNSVNWGSIITMDSISALEAAACPGANKQKDGSKHLLSFLVLKTDL